MNFRFWRSVSQEEAKKVNGWITFISAEDITGENKSLFGGQIMATEEVFILKRGYIETYGICNAFVDLFVCIVRSIFY